MAFNDIFKSVDFFKILSKIQPILLNYLITKVVNKVFNEINHSLVKKISRSVKRLRYFLSRLKSKPNTIQLALDIFAPE